jgi:uncharacterized protein YwgA
MTRRDWLLLFAAYEGAPHGLDPIRFQKGLFLFAKRAHVPARAKYIFKPYDYGPMSAGIYRDLDALVDQGLLERVEVPGKHWSRYRSGRRTFREGQRLLRQADKEKTLDAARELYRIKQEVATVGFSELLDRVYSEYPDFAVKSVFRRSA